ncbi:MULTISPECIES: hypothetical protein, partial [Dethiosulfovibrio]
MSPLFLRPMIQQPVLHLNLATYSVVHFSGSTILPSWRNDREIVEDRLIWRAWEKVLSGTVNSYYLPPGEKRIYLHLQDSLNGL